MKRIFVWFALLLLVFTSVSALYGISYDTYSGQAARERRAYYDPYSRERYFGENHVQTFGGFGSKGPVTGTLTNTGAKSAYSGTFNLDTDEFWHSFRGPSRVGANDPGMRGFDRMDKVVRLYPYTFVQRDYPVGDPSSINHLSKATARVQSLSNSFYSAYKDRPQGIVMMKIRELPPLSSEELYEAWIVDEDSGYPLSMGLFKTGIQGTASFDFEIRRPLMGFDTLVVTREPFPDYDPRPSNDIILVGFIEPPREQGYDYVPEVTIR